MSQLRSSLAVDEFRDSIIEPQLELVKPRHELMSNATKEQQPIYRAVKVSGSITVSF